MRARPFTSSGTNAALVGGVLGAGTGIVALAGGAALVLVATFGAPTGGLEDFGFWALVGAAWLVGGYVGLGVGCWLALRRRGDEAAAATARWSVAIAISGWLVSGATSALGEAIGLDVVAVGFGTYLVALCLAPIAGRRIAARRGT